MEKQTFQIPSGCKTVSIEQIGDIIVTTFEKEHVFKKGDFIVTGTPSRAFAIVDKQISENNFDLNVYFNISTGNFYKEYSANAFYSARLATDEENQLLLDKMHENGYDWDAEKMEVVKYRWKPEKGKPYIYPSLTNSKFYSTQLWDGGNFDMCLYERQLVFKPIEADNCINATKKMLEAVK